MAKKYTSTINEYHLNLHQPTKKQFAMYDLGPYLEEYGERASKPHIHSFYQIIWFKKGKGKHFVDFKEYEVADNSIFFIAKDQVHYFDKNQDYKGVLLNFNESFLVQKNSEVEFFLKCNIFNNLYQTPFCCVNSSINILLDDYLRLIRIELEKENEFGKEELLRGYLKAFLIQVQRRKNEFERDNEHASFLVDDKKMQLVKFITLVDENYKKGLTVMEYAEELHISTRTLSDLTNQFLGKSPSLIIQERIVLEARRLLLHSEMNINQIAYRLGFDDPSYFVKYFKKHVQVSPSEFRKSITE
ncbi:helix-turn-helix domain-containing protein [Empedobacter stercoris]|uniref:AraC family transcriptional regulator n=1 Tax=Empedobacter stercoris TaxID=1628248 RepID=UPI0016621C88|nr:AraC family transcriptional regulator [Empedobacter stercoris]MCA4810358.1 helix-turn-helix domain-containing protein [Empedobacter stercoris]QNT13557.1 helix-turn-helix domain-containing protein [Empedobacter stercoris]